MSALSQATTGAILTASAELKKLGVWHGEIMPAAGQSTRSTAVSAIAAAPLPPRPPLSHGAFDSVAIPVGNIAMAAKWNSVTDRDYSAFFTPQCGAAGFDNCTTPFARQMHGIFEAAADRSPIEKLRLVNAGVNGAIRYRTDAENWGMGDYWANPIEIAQRGAGDCEDYAIAKMGLLQALGFNASQLQMIVLQDTRRQLYHAVLAVHVDGERYILDNLANTVRIDSYIGEYMPLVSFVENRSFIHGFDQRRAMTAALPSDLTAVQPGEGL